MINTQFKAYDYYKYSTNSYGQSTPNLNEVVGQVTLAINTINQAVGDSILYKNASYIALTWDKDIDDTYLIQYTDKERLKVLYVSAPSKYKLRQVYLQKIQ